MCVFFGEVHQDATRVRLLKEIFASCDRGFKPNNSRHRGEGVGSMFTSGHHADNLFQLTKTVHHTMALIKMQTELSSQ